MTPDERASVILRRHQWLINGWSTFGDQGCTCGDKTIRNDHEMARHQLAALKAVA